MKDKARSLDSLAYCAGNTANSLVNLSSSYTRLAVKKANGSDSIGPDSFQPLLPSDEPSQLDIRQLSGSLTGNGYTPVKDNSEHDCGRHRAKVPNKNRRERWRNRTEFLLTLIGYTVGLGNVWRFPFLCHKNGGASFLIPYGIMLAVEGIPLYYMELCIGQKMRKGAVGVWNDISPYLGGVGIASAVVCFLVSLYYNVIIAWCVFYFFTSFQSDLPWSKCPTEEVTYGNVTTVQPVRECALARPTSYFWYRTTLQTSSGIEDSGSMNWKLCACLAVTWLLVWLCMMKGIKVTGKIVYVTALLPIVLLIIFFFCGVHLDGYQDGLALLFVPDFERLKDPLVWLDAAVQIFFSLGVAYGSLIAFSSYNPIKNDSTRDAITVCLIDCATSIYASVVVFCFIGFQAQNMMNDCVLERKEQIIRIINITGAIGEPSLDWDHIERGVYDALLNNASAVANETLKVCNKSDFLVMPSGQGLAFLTFTDAINKMPLGPLWSVVFFLMLITIGIDTEFGMLEGVVTPLIDMKLSPKWTKEKISGLICLVSFLMGLPLVQSSGEYWLQLYDSYCSGIPLLIIALVECLAISYTYGIDRFSKDIKYMTNKPPRFIWKWCWKMISPLAILAILCMSIKGMSEQTPKYGIWDRTTGKVVYVPYPPWAKFLAFLLIFISIFFIPAVAVLRYFRILSMPGENKPRENKPRPLNNIAELTDTTELQPLFRGNGEDQMIKECRFRDDKVTNIDEHEKRLARLNGEAYHVVSQANGQSQFV